MTEKSVRTDVMTVRCTLLAVILGLAGCVTVPAPARNHQNRCEISTDKLTLRIIDVAHETYSYYSIEGLLLSPILVPATAVVSGTFVLVNNIYRLGEEKIVCGDG